jgi:hypothetical protein
MSGTSPAHGRGNCEGSHTDTEGVLPSALPRASTWSASIRAASPAVTRCCDSDLIQNSPSFIPTDTSSYQIAPSTYYAALTRPKSAREIRDEELKREIQRVYDENYKVYGARKIWWELHREGIGGVHSRG